VTAQATRQAVRAGRPAASADAPILAAKITVPGVPDWAVPRPRITKLIAQGRRWCPLTVITAPAGAGKTMALALWAAAESRSVTWVGLDRFDNQPGVFWNYVVAALRRSGVAIPEALPTAAREAGHLFLLRLAAALAAQDPPVTLVLDDLHLLADPQVLDGLDYVLRNTGGGLRLVVSARMDPPLPLHRYRVAGQLTEIRASDLAFTVAEAGLLLARQGVTLTADSLECLARRTEGWAAGLRLAAISMGTHPDPDQFVTELISDNSPLTAYLVAEALNTQPPAARDVLLSTSILEQVSAQAASELTGNEQAAAILPAMAHANGFIQPTRSGWYRYHPLFAEVLRLKLSREYPDRRAALHRRAARWYERDGQLTDAVRHAAQADDWPLAASIVIDQLAIGEIIEPRGGPSLAGEFGGMPHGRAWTEPQPHLVSAAVALSAGRPESSTAALDAAEGILERLPADREVPCRLAAAMIRRPPPFATGTWLRRRRPLPEPRCWPPRRRAASSPGTLTSGPACCPAAALSSCGQAIWTRRPMPWSRGWPPRRRAAGRTNQRTAWDTWRWLRLCAAGCAARPRWPAGRPRPRWPAGSGCRSRAPAPRRLSPWPGCTWNTMSCVRRTAGSRRPTLPSAQTRTS
jgi:LuxR family transcriptional regulator, maltose regulon positive regulatory protein